MKNALLLFLVLVFVKTFSQDEGHWTDKVESPVVIVKNDNAKLDLSSTKVDAKIVGVIADVTITQTYKNSGEEDVDASYLFPGSSKSAVYGMIMKVGDKTIKAKIKEKEKAKEEFEKAKAEGKKASLMQQHRPNVFQMDLANIPAGDQMEITIQYTEILIPEDGDYEFVFPTIVGPRFANPEDVLAEPWIAQSNQEPEQVLKNGNIQINVDIDAPLPLTQVKNRTHSSKITKSGKEAHISHVIDKAKELKDFIVSFRLKGDEIQTGISTFEGKDENFFLFMMESPDREKIVMVPPREYIFIIDVSGSMGGFPITVTKELMENLMKGMHVQDRFNVLLFAGDS
ncbi:MAG: VIT and VWA domain-containing protein, partial [Flavobacteriales bacterium]|nr:VIT and VWA domain-containing protein [Flavobacteriales bacterium]